MDLPDSNSGVIPAKYLPHISAIDNHKYLMAGFCLDQSSQSMFLGQASLSSITSGNSWEMHIHRPDSRFTELETLEGNLFFNKCSGGFWCTLKFKTHRLSLMPDSLPRTWPVSHLYTLQAASPFLPFVCGRIILFFADTTAF